MTKKQYQCKQCEAAFENRVDLMNHYRVEHPKGKDDEPKGEPTTAVDAASENDEEKAPGALITSDDVGINNATITVANIPEAIITGTIKADELVFSPEIKDKKLHLPVHFCPNEVKLLSQGRVVGLRVMGTLQDGYIVVDQIDLL